MFKWLSRWLATTGPNSHRVVRAHVRSPEPEVRRQAAERLGEIT